MAISLSARATSETTPETGRAPADGSGSRGAAGCLEAPRFTPRFTTVAAWLSYAVVHTHSPYATTLAAMVIRAVHFTSGSGALRSAASPL